MMLTISVPQAQAFVFARQQLSAPTDDITAMVGQQIVVQTQLDQGLEHSTYARVAGSSRAAVLAALGARQLVKTWTIRATKHTVRANDLPLVVAAANREREQWFRANSEKRFGLTAAQLDEVEAGIMAAAAQGPLTRQDMHARVPLLQNIDPRTWNGSMMGLVYRGEMVFADGPNFARRDQWLPDLDWTLPDEDVAQREFIRRFFYAYGPATAYDLAHWAGWRITDTRTRLHANIDLFEPVTVEGWEGDFHVLREDVESLQTADPDSIPAFLLIGKFDSMSIGWKDKTRFLDEAHYKQVYKKAAQIEATFWFEGRVAGAWRTALAKKKLTMTAVPFRKLLKGELKQLEAGAQSLAGFYGLGETVLDMADAF